MCLLCLAGDIHPNPGPLNIGHINCRSLISAGTVHSTQATKLDEICATMKDASFDIVCLSETWLDNRIPDSDIEIEEYVLYRRDRNRHGGGVAIYASQSLVTKRRSDLELRDTESLWIECTLRDKRCLVASYYRPPGQSTNEIDNFLTNLQTTFDLINLENVDFVVILGDFNDRCSTWDSNHPESELKLGLYDMLNTNLMFQIISEPTRITANTASILDLIITDAPGYVTKSGILPPIFNLDHCIIYCSLEVHHIQDPSYTRETWNYNAADFDAFRADLDRAPWHIAYRSYDDIDDITSYWCELFMSIARRHVPNSKVRCRPRDKPWMTSNIRKLLRQRNRAWKRFKRTKSPMHEDIYKQARRTVKTAIKHAKHQHVETLNNRLSDPSCTPKEYWKTLSQFLGSKLQHGIPPIIHEDQVLSDPADKAECFNSFFVEQSRMPPPPEGFALPPLPRPLHTLNAIQTTPIEVYKILCSLNVNKANGPDNISNRLLKEAAPAIAEPLCDLFNASLARGVFPSQWKQANVVPVFKKGDKSLVSNHRPISLLPVISKVFERVVFRHLFAYLDNHSLLTWRNSGFKPLDSTVNQLIFLTHKIQEALDKGKDVVMVFLDISKAFDKVYHDGLLHKLQTLGISGSLLEWFRGYLTNRKQRVVLNGQASSWQYTNAGVPQGSILGPLLFLVFINDLVDSLITNPYLFADDTSLLEIIDNVVESSIRLNTDLLSLQDWASQWRVTFNELKSVYMVFSRKLNRPALPPLYMNNSQLRQVDSHKHLGLTLTQTLSWEEHIVNICTKANKRIGILKRLTKTLTRQAKETVYLSFIRPVLEYAAVIYDGCPNRLVKMLEGVQRQAALACTRAYLCTSHNALLDELGWDRLCTRRECHKLNMFYKIKYNLCPRYLSTLCPPMVDQTTMYNLRNARDIVLPRSRTVSFRRSFLPSAVHQWNGLDLTLRSQPTLSRFSSHIKQTKCRLKNRLYASGNGHGPVNHSRMRMGLSALNGHRHRYHFIDSSKCVNCNSPLENPQHYFLDCPLYAAQRQALFANLANIPVTFPISPNDKISFTKLLLTGNINAQNPSVNAELLFKSVRHYIQQTRRF